MEPSKPVLFLEQGMEGVVLDCGMLQEAIQLTISVGSKVQFVQPHTPNNSKTNCSSDDELLSE